MRSAVILVLVILLAASSVATAAPIPPTVADPAAGDADLAAIARALETRLVAAHLRTLGLTPEAVQAHLASIGWRSRSPRSGSAGRSSAS
jgi:hypothetical protein